METIKCEACGSSDVIVENGYYVCQYCGTKSLLVAQGKTVSPKQFPVLPKNYMCPEGAINGLFSVGPNEWVLFSKGNLQNHASTGHWRFAERQYDIVGETGLNDGWNDLFGWDTAKVPESNAGWFTLSIVQWTYLLKKRSVASDMRFVKAQVVGVNGIILLPDSWNTSYYVFFKVNRVEANYTENAISASDWETKLQSNGAVFLPAAGHRDGTKVLQSGSFGFYWSSTGGSFGRANCMNFNAANLDPCDGKGRSNGYAVRMVCPVRI